MMNSSNSRMNKCSKCHSRPVQVTCDDCSQRFCNTCYADHQRYLTDEYQQLCYQIDSIKEFINSSSSTNAPNTAHDIIARWEQRMYQEISNTASKLHHQLDQRTRNVASDIRPSLNKITTELNSMRKIETYIERDIYRIKQQLFDIETKLKQLNGTVEIDEDKMSKLDLSSSIRFNDQKTIIPVSTTPHSGRQNKSTQKDQERDRPSPSINSHRGHSTQMASLTESNRPPLIFRRQPSHQSTYQCICCKQMNVYDDNQENRCDTCKTPYNF